MALFRFTLIACLLGLAAPPVLAVPVSAPVPLDSWVYPALEKLEGLGLIDSALKGSRPYTRLEAARQTREARDKMATTPAPPVAGEIVRRLEGELAASLTEVRGESAGGYFKPLREARLEYVHREGAAAAILGTNARQHALSANNFGIDHAEGGNLYGALETEARLRSFFLLHWRPLFSADDEDTDFTTLDGGATLGLGPIHVSAGRGSLWWGQGRNGTLILTDNAKPLDMLRITNPAPVLLPWIFRGLGPFRFDVFWSELEADRHIPEPYLAGLRINFKPRPWLEIGASRTVIFGGEGRPDVSFSEFITILGGKNLSGEGDTSNQLAAIDARLSIAPLGGAQLYGEYGGEDEAGGFFSKKAFLAGLYLPRLESSGRLGLRLEYADLNFRGNGRYWYRHSQWQSGYTYEKHLLGHPVGGDARDYFAALEWYHPAGGTLTAGINVQRRGLSGDTVERHVQPFVEFEQPWRGQYRLCAGFALDRVDNADYIRGEKRTDHLIRLALARTW